MALFLLFWSFKYSKFIAENTTMITENTKSTIVALVYLGPGLRDPNSHVARMPPELVRMKPIAIAVARQVWGAALLANHVHSVGATM
jgi:hypothetical protein